MYDKNYKINKDNIYAGEVVLATRIYRYRYQNGTSELDVENYKYLRTMLFVLDQDNKANDLLYNSPHYLILNKSDDNECLKFKNGIVIRTLYNLNELLLDDKLELSYEDIKKIRKEYFNGAFYKDNQPLMGSAFNKYAYLDELGDHFIWETIGNDRKVNAFKPSRREHVKRLKKGY